MEPGQESSFPLALPANGVMRPGKTQIQRLATAPNAY